MDLAEQLAAVWARRVIVIGAAGLVGIGVFFWSSARPEQYDATSTVQVRLPDTDSSDPSTQVDYYAETVIGLVTSRAVIEDALAELGREDDPDEVAEQVAAELGTEPGFVSVTAGGETAAGSASLADALVAAVDRRVAADQAEDRTEERELLTQELALVLEQLQQLPEGYPGTRAALIREREELLSALRTNANTDVWQVAPVDSAEPPAEPTSPFPARDALLGFLIALIVVAEAIVIRRAWRGAVSARDPAGDVGEALGVPTVEVGHGDGIAAVAPLLPYLGTGARVTVLHVGGRPRARTATLLAGLLAVRGREVLLVDAAPDRPSVHRDLQIELTPGLTDLPSAEKELGQALAELPKVGDLHVLAAGAAAGAADGDDGPSPASTLTRVEASFPGDCVVVAASVARLDDLIAALSDGSDGPVVVDVEAASATRRELREAAAAWQALAVNVVAATVQT